MQHITTVIWPSGEGKNYLSPLGLSEDDISHKNLRAAMTRRRNELRREYSTPSPEGASCLLSERKAWVPNQLSKEAKRKVLESCGLIQAIYGAGNVCFFTGTFPTRDDADLELINKGWQESVRRWTRKLKYHLEEAGLPDYWVYKVEFHQDDWPHIHAVWPGRKGKGNRWAISKELAQKIWRNSWEHVGLKEQFMNWNYSTRVEVVRKSAAGYMAKYLSKTASSQQLKKKTSVTRFWGSSRSMKTLLKSNTYESSSEGSYPDLLNITEVLLEKDGLAECSPLIRTQSGGMWQGFTVSEGRQAYVCSEIERLAHEELCMEEYERFSLKGSPVVYGKRSAKRKSHGKRRS